MRPLGGISAITNPEKKRDKRKAAEAGHRNYKEFYLPFLPSSRPLNLADLPLKNRTPIPEGSSLYLGKKKVLLLQDRSSWETLNNRPF
jgi:hypothetical protein